MRFGRTTLAIGVFLALGAGAVRANVTNWIREIEITPDPIRDGHQIFAFRFMPDKTASYDLIAFECTYHQEFPWEDVRGRKYTKIHEPVTFVFRRAGPSFVNDLDAYINFRVPMAMPLLIQSYGPTTFNKEAPISISTIAIVATVNGQTAWSVKLPSKGKFDARPLTPYKEPPPDPAATNQPPANAGVAGTASRE
jgi:hypothetical protein